MLSTYTVRYNSCHYLSAKHTKGRNKWRVWIAGLVWYGGGELDSESALERTTRKENHEMCPCLNKYKSFKLNGLRIQINLLVFLSSVLFIVNHKNAFVAKHLLPLKSWSWRIRCPLSVFPLKKVVLFFCVSTKKIDEIKKDKSSLMNENSWISNVSQRKDENPSGDYICSLSS